jgi:hypothetical protein
MLAWAWSSLQCKQHKSRIRPKSKKFHLNFNILHQGLQSISKTINVLPPFLSLWYLYIWNPIFLLVPFTTPDPFKSPPIATDGPMQKRIQVDRGGRKKLMAEILYSVFRFHINIPSVYMQVLLQYDDTLLFYI